MAILTTIQNNYNAGYTQGVFANGLNRSNIYRDALSINQNPLNRQILLNNFLINTLMWGNFDVVVGRYHHTNAVNVINGIPNFSNYSTNFINNLNNANISISDKYSLFLNNGLLKLPYVGYAYFTKFLHFYSFGNNQQTDMLILDKWAIYSWCSIIIELNLVNEFPLLPRLLKLRKGKFIPQSITGNLYQRYNQFFSAQSALLNMTTNEFEEQVFGWDLRQQNGFVNPRIEILQTLYANTNLF
jgi:uncharacterized membrane protein